MAVTDANLLLGRLIPKYFPKIFGDSAKEELDIDASAKAFDELCEQINSESSESKKSRDEIAYGLVYCVRIGQVTNLMLFTDF